jgi:hypothetical protein
LLLQVKQEWEVHSSLSHPNIIQAYLGMEDSQGVRLFMEYAGVSLRTLVGWWQQWQQWQGAGLTLVLLQGAALLLPVAPLAAAVKVATKHVQPSKQP